MSSYRVDVMPVFKKGKPLKLIAQPVKVGAPTASLPKLTVSQAGVAKFVCTSITMAPTISKVSVGAH